MLEVMSAGSTALPGAKGDRGILLDCWDKPSPLIEELERTVNFAERKCGDLMQQLHFYKEYYEKWAQVERVNHLCHRKKIKKSFRQSSEVGSSSENEFEKVNQYFYKKIKSKITEMNNEITEANRKIHTNPEIPPPPSLEASALRLPFLEPQKITHDTPHSPSVTIENKVSKSEPTMASIPDPGIDAGGIKVLAKQSSKSVPARSRAFKSSKRDSGPAKKRYSALQRFKIRSKSLPQGVRRKFGFGGFFEVFEPESSFRDGARPRNKSKTSLKADSSKSIRSRKSRTRAAEVRKLTPKNSRHRITKSRSDIRYCFKSTRCEPAPKKTENAQQLCPMPHSTPKKETNICKAIVPSSSISDTSKTQINFTNNLKNLMANPSSLLPFLQHPIPFIPCSSTSRSFNLGLNVQQVLSLIKRKRHSVTLQAIVKNSMQAARSITESMVDTLFISQTTTSHSHVTSALCPAREGSEDGFSVITHNRSKCSLLKQVQTMRSQAIEDKMSSTGSSVIEVKKLERPEDVWVVEQPDSSSREVRNVRSRCTCFPSKHCVDYHKVLRQYTGWRLPVGSHTDRQSSYLCSKSKLYAIPSQDNMEFGMGENDGRIELMKVQNDLANLTRKYSSLQEQIYQNCLDDYEANAELDALESELAIREVELKDILNFYKQLMVLKGKLKSLRVRNDQSQTELQQQEFQRPKKDPLRPTPSMALAKALKKIQGLQDKIKLIDAP